MTKTKTLVTVVALLLCALMLGANASAFAAAEAETRYADAPILSTYADEQIYYTRKEIVEEHYTYGDCPLFIGLSDLSNECGAVAGAEIVAFYDRYFPEFIPNWTPYYSNGYYRRQDSTYVPPLIRDLYVRMRTNVDDVGVSESDFLNGLKSYINSKGQQVTYQSVKSGNTLNYSQCKSAIDNNKVIALFVLPTNVYEIILNSGRDYLYEKSIAGAHIMVAYGYLKINYYNNSGLFRTDTYLCVSTGRDDLPIAYYRVNETTTQAAYIVTVQ